MTKKRKKQTPLPAMPPRLSTERSVSVPRDPEDIADDAVSEFQANVVPALGPLAFRILRKLHVSIVMMLEQDREHCSEVALRGLFFDRFGQWVRKEDMNHISRVDSSRQGSARMGGFRQPSL